MAVDDLEIGLPAESMEALKELQLQIEQCLEGDFPFCESPILPPSINICIELHANSAHAAKIAFWVGAFRTHD